MKISNLSKLVGVGALSLSLSILPMVHPASAQTGPTNDTAPNTTTPNTTTNVESNDRLDWGWLGLLGLGGLAGLAGKKRDNNDGVRYTESDASRTGTTSYRQ